MIRYRCPRCKKTLTAQDSVAGVKINCPQCKQRLQVPRPPPPPNKTMLGESDDRGNKTVLGRLEGEHLEIVPPSEGYTGGPPPVRRTILVDQAALNDAATDAPDALEIPEVEVVSPRQRRRYEEDDADYRPRRRSSARPACPRCGCTDYPRQTTKFGAASIVLLVIGIIFWPLLIVAFFLQEKWDICSECGEKLRQTGTGF